MIDRSESQLIGREARNRAHAESSKIPGRQARRPAQRSEKKSGQRGPGTVPL